MLALYRLVFLMKKAMNNYSYLSRIRCINCSPIIASVFFINSLAFSANGSSINSRLSCRHLSHKSLTFSIIILLFVCLDCLVSRVLISETISLLRSPFGLVAALVPSPSFHLQNLLHLFLLF